MNNMTKKIAWDIFKQTGNVNAFLGIKNMEYEEASKYENSKNDWNNNSRETNSRL